MNKPRRSELRIEAFKDKQPKQVMGGMKLHYSVARKSAEGEWETMESTFTPDKNKAFRWLKIREENIKNAEYTIQFWWPPHTIGK